MIRLNNLGSKVGKFRLSGISLELPQGSYTVLLGDSGSGKSMLLELLAGLRYPDEGSVYFEGRDITRLPPGSRPFGMVFQDLALFPHLTVRDNIAFPLKSAKTPKDGQEDRIRELASRFGIEPLLDRFPNGLSGGEKQRVALARTLALNPACLLLDEPLAAIDARIRKEIRSLLRNLNRDGQTIIHVTHDYLEAVSLASHIGILEQGRLVRFGPAAGVLANPASPFMASFTGIRNFIPVEIRLDEADNLYKGWTETGIPIVFTTRKDHGRGYLIIPEESVFLSSEPVSTSAANQLRGTVTELVPVPHGTEVVIDVGFTLHALLTRESAERPAYRPGMTVFAGFKASGIRFVKK